MRARVRMARAHARMLYHDEARPLGGVRALLHADLRAGLHHGQAFKNSRLVAAPGIPGISGYGAGSSPGMVRVPVSPE